jgi:hypothetical protein
MATNRICDVPDCGKKRIARGYCYKHYERQKRHGDPLGGGTFIGEPTAFYESAVLTHNSDACLLWPYTRGSDGYARIRKLRGETLIQRLICFDIYGPPPSELHEAAHTCGHGMQGCVNPRHIRWATRDANAADKVAHGTSPRGTNCGRAKLSEEDVRTIRRLRAMKVPNRVLAKRFAISPAAISNINTGVTWWWLK